MLQRTSSALRRVARPVSFSGWIPRTGVPILKGCGETHNRMKTNRNPQLFRLMSTSAGQVSTRRARSTVNSLDPDRLHISDIIELSGSNYPSAIFGTSGVCVLHYHSITPPGRTRGIAIPFPPGTRGFLYLHRRPCLPPGAGEIRFRVLDPGYVSDSATELFARGKDLLDHAGHAPWRIHMLHLYTKAQGVHIRRLLLRQGLITPSQDATVQQCYPADKKHYTRDPLILERISDPFTLRLPIQTIRATLLREEGILRSYPAAWNVCWRWTPKPKVAPLSLPYDGYVVARFELRKGGTSDADPSQEEEVKLVLRILKLLDPVAPDGSTYELPEGGDLAQSLARDGRRYWSSPMDTARRFINPSSMKILEDLYLGEGATAPAEG